jgi:hypothetical protein
MVVGSAGANLDIPLKRIDSPATAFRNSTSCRHAGIGKFRSGVNAKAQIHSRRGSSG